MDYPYSLGPGAPYDSAACMVTAGGDNQGFGVASPYSEFNSCAHSQVWFQNRRAKWRKMERAKQQQLQPHISQDSPNSSGSGDIANDNNNNNPYDVTDRRSVLSDAEPKGISEAVSPDSQNIKDGDDCIDEPIAEIGIPVTPKDQTSLMKVGLSPGTPAKRGSTPERPQHNSSSVAPTSNLDCHTARVNSNDSNTNVAESPTNACLQSHHYHHGYDLKPTSQTNRAQRIYGGNAESQGSSQGYSSPSSVSWLLSGGNASSHSTLHGAPFVDVLSALTRNVGSTAALMTSSHHPSSTNGLYYNSALPNRYQDCGKVPQIPDSHGQDIRSSATAQDCRTRANNGSSSDNIIASL